MNIEEYAHQLSKRNKSSDNKPMTTQKEYPPSLKIKKIKNYQNDTRYPIQL